MSNLIDIFSDEDILQTLTAKNKITKADLDAVAGRELTSDELDEVSEHLTVMLDDTDFIVENTVDWGNPREAAEDGAMSDFYWKLTEIRDSISKFIYG